MMLPYMSIIRSLPACQMPSSLTAFLTPWSQITTSSLFTSTPVSNFLSAIRKAYPGAPAGENSPSATLAVTLGSLHQVPCPEPHSPDSQCPALILRNSLLVLTGRLIPGQPNAPKDAFGGAGLRLFNFMIAMLAIEDLVLRSEGNSDVPPTDAVYLALAIPTMAGLFFGVRQTIPPAPKWTASRYIQYIRYDDEP
jgi:hypothetical protein